MAERRIRVGIGGWTYAPWRKSFYPDDLPQSRELEYASSKLTTIEINGTFYRSQKPETFAKWYSETPDDFAFSVKAPRYATNRRVLAEAGESVDRFMTGGVLELGEKLGVINWQFAPTKRFDPEDFGAFLELLPGSVAGQAIRHAVEVRHDSFRTPDFVAQVRERGIAVVVAGDSSYPQIADPTAPFVCARIMGTQEAEPAGYPPAALDAWAARAKAWASGKPPDGFAAVGAADGGDGVAREVFLYVISGFKLHNPAAAMALHERLS